MINLNPFKKKREKVSVFSLENEEISEFASVVKERHEAILEASKELDADKREAIERISEVDGKMVEILKRDYTNMCIGEPFFLGATMSGTIVCHAASYTVQNGNIVLLGSSGVALEGLLAYFKQMARQKKLPNMEIKVHKEAILDFISKEELEKNGLFS